MLKLLNTFDNFFIDLINKKMKHPLLDVFFYKVTFFGGATFVTILTLLMVIFGHDDGFRTLGLKALVAQLLTALVVQTMKKLFSRERPYKVLKGLNTFDINMRDYSFPSGHTAASFSLALVISVNYTYLVIPMFIYAITIGISRIYLGVHYPSDVLAGMVIALIMSTIGNVWVSPMAIDTLQNLIHMFRDMFR